MRITIEINIPPLFDARRWLGRFHAVATAMHGLTFNPFLLQIDSRQRAPAVLLEDGFPIVRNGEWWDMYHKAKVEYDLMRSHVIRNCDPCLPADRWDGSPIPDAERH